KELMEVVKVLQDRYNTLVKKQETGETVDLNELKDAAERVQAQEQLANRRLAQKTKEFERERDRNIQKIRNETESVATRIRRFYKVVILWPPIIILSLMGLVVFGFRRLREREGISRSRLVG